MNAKKILSIALLFIGLASCSNDNDDVKSTANLKLRSIDLNYKDSNSDTTHPINYTYDEENRLSKVQTVMPNIIKLEFTYQNNLVYKIKLIEGNQFTDFTYYYNGDSIIPYRIVAEGNKNFERNYQIINNTISWNDESGRDFQIFLVGNKIDHAIMNEDHIKITYSDANENFKENIQSLELLTAMSFYNNASTLYAFDIYGIQLSKTPIQRCEMISDGQIYDYELIKDLNGNVSQKVINFPTNTITHTYTYN